MEERALPATGGGRRPEHTEACGRAPIGAMVPSLAVQAGEGLRPMSQSIVHASPEAKRKAPPGPLRLSPLWLLFAALALAVPVAPLLLTQRAPELPDLGQLPSFSLVDQDGKPFGAHQGRGKVWLRASFLPAAPFPVPA